MTSPVGHRDGYVEQLRTELEMPRVGIGTVDGQAHMTVAHQEIDHAPPRAVIAVADGEHGQPARRREQSVGSIRAVAEEKHLAAFRLVRLRTAHLLDGERTAIDWLSANELLEHTGDVIASHHAELERSRGISGPANEGGELVEIGGLDLGFGRGRSGLGRNEGQRGE